MLRWSISITLYLQTFCCVCGLAIYLQASFFYKSCNAGLITVDNIMMSLYTITKYSEIILLMSQHAFSLKIHYLYKVYKSACFSMISQPNFTDTELHIFTLHKGKHCVAISAQIVNLYEGILFVFREFWRSLIWNVE